MVTPKIFASTFEYTKLETFEDFDAVFVLSNEQNNNQTVKLDCQSYFHKLDVLDKQGAILEENFISFGECEYMYDNITQCLHDEKSKCIDSEDIFNTSCSCD